MSPLDPLLPSRVPSATYRTCTLVPARTTNFPQCAKISTRRAICLGTCRNQAQRRHQLPRP